MCQLFETIKIQNGTSQNFEYHIHRVRKTRAKLFGCEFVSDFEELLNGINTNTSNIYKLKVIYNNKIISYEITEYSMLNKSFIKFFDLPNFEYQFKFTNRNKFEEIEKQLKGNEIGVITQNGYLTDATYANVVLFDGSNYYTPKNCLLEGTKRQRLLNENRIKPTLIHINELNKFEYLQIINAMIDLEDNIKISLNSI